jgi:hypothetical protein
MVELRLLYNQDTKLTEKVHFQLRAEFFNLFNHATFASPTSNLSNASFGSSLTTASAERQIQFGGRFTPRLGSLLSEQELMDLLAYIRNALERCRPSVLDLSILPRQELSFASHAQLSRA